MKFDLHSNSLDELVNHLGLVGEEPSIIQWVMTEGVWLKPGITEKYKLCDLIVHYYPFSFGVEVRDLYSLIELKRNRKMKHHAIEQLESSEMFVRECFSPDATVTKKIAYYDLKFDYDVV